MTTIDPQDIQWRVGSTYEKGEDVYGMLLGYIDSRTAMDELDRRDSGWSDEYAIVNLEGVQGVQCALTVNGVTRTDVGVASNTEGLIGAYSDALKRAAVKHGIGRELYDLPTVAVACETYVKAGKKHVKRPKALPSWNGSRWTIDRQYGWVKYDREPNQKPEQGEAAVPSGGAERRSVPAAPAPAHPAIIDPDAAAARERMLAAAEAAGVGMDVLGRMAIEVGIPAGQKGSVEQYDLMAAMLRPTDTAPDSGTDGPPSVEGPVAQEAAGGTPAASDPLQERIDRANKRAAAAKPKSGSPQTVDAPEVAEPMEMAL